MSFALRFLNSISVFPREASNAFSPAVFLPAPPTALSSSGWKLAAVFALIAFNSSNSWASIWANASAAASSWAAIVFSSACRGSSAARSWSKKLLIPPAPNCPVALAAIIALTSLPLSCWPSKLIICSLTESNALATAARSSSLAPWIPPWANAWLRILKSCPIWARWSSLPNAIDSCKSWIWPCLSLRLFRSSSRSAALPDWSASLSSSAFVLAAALEASLADFPSLSISLALATGSNLPVASVIGSLPNFCALFLSSFACLFNLWKALRVEPTSPAVAPAAAASPPSLAWATLLLEPSLACLLWPSPKSFSCLWADFSATSVTLAWASISLSWALTMPTLTWLSFDKNWFCISTPRLNTFIWSCTVCFKSAPSWFNSEKSSDPETFSEPMIFSACLLIWSSMSFDTAPTPPAGASIWSTKSSTCSLIDRVFVPVFLPVFGSITSTSRWKVSNTVGKLSVIAFTLDILLAKSLASFSASLDPLSTPFPRLAILSIDSLFSWSRGWSNTLVSICIAPNVSPPPGVLPVLSSISWKLDRVVALCCKNWLKAPRYLFVLSSVRAFCFSTASACKVAMVSFCLATSCSWPESFCCAFTTAISAANLCSKTFLSAISPLSSAASIWGLNSRVLACSNFSIANWVASANFLFCCIISSMPETDAKAAGPRLSSSLIASPTAWFASCLNTPAWAIKSWTSFCCALIASFSCLRNSSSSARLSLSASSAPLTASLSSTTLPVSVFLNKPSSKSLASKSFFSVLVDANLVSPASKVAFEFANTPARMSIWSAAPKPASWADSKALARLALAWAALNCVLANFSAKLTAISVALALCLSCLSEASPKILKARAAPAAAAATPKRTPPTIWPATGMACRLAPVIARVAATPATAVAVPARPPYKAAAERLAPSWVCANFCCSRLADLILAFTNFSSSAATPFWPIFSSSSCAFSADFCKAMSSLASAAADFPASFAASAKAVATPAPISACPPADPTVFDTPPPNFPRPRPTLLWANLLPLILSPSLSKRPFPFLPPGRSSWAKSPADCLAATPSSLTASVVASASCRWATEEAIW